MYRRILLASDGTRESLVALREGALVARAFRAAAFLLIVEPETVGHRMADGVYPVPRHDQQAQELLSSSLSRLSRLGVGADGEWVRGDPGQEIARCALRFGADLIVLGHRRKTLIERWWSGASGGYLVDQVGCSVLLARDVITDEEFETHLASSL